MVSVEVQGVPQIEGVGGTIPWIRLTLSLNAHSDPAFHGNVSVLDLIPAIHLQGVRIASVVPEDIVRFGQPIGELVGRPQRLQLIPSRDEWDAIERARVHDVSLNVSLQLRCVLQPTGTAALQFQTLYAASYVDISEAKWLKVLEPAGFKSSWVLRVDRPSIAGWAEVVNFLTRAQSKLELRDPEGVITECRALWMALEPLLSSKWLDIAKEIDRGSVKEQGQPLKSERADAIKKDLIKFSHTGAHTEAYAATMADAFLTFRLTAALVSYFSEKLLASESRTENRG